MLEQIDLSKILERADYKSFKSELELKLSQIQQQVRTAQIPVMIVFEGWDAAGKGTLINRLILALDPRSYSVHPINPPTKEEKLRPFLWRFWTKTPERGRVAIFDRSWYGRVLVERVDKVVKKKIWKQAYAEINTFEKQLVNDGTVIIKFFLHISKKEQKKRFIKLEKNPATEWKVTDDDWKHHEQYKKYAEVIEEMLEKTDTEVAPWTIVEAHDRRYATVKIFRTVISAIERRLEQVAEGLDYDQQQSSKLATLPPKTESILDKVDLTLTMSREEYDQELKIYQNKIRELEHKIYLKRLPVIIVYQGWDAAGKGGNIKRLVGGMDPRGYEVVPICAPNDLERNHHYLWRFWMNIPKGGHITIFDRSWYGRVLVERIEGFCSEKEWRRAYREINEMEQMLANYGTLIIKFWLHINKEEQLRRFKDRENTPHKRWKMSEEDYRNREKWDPYKAAVDDMILKTSTSYAPWTIIEANCKLFARIKVLKTVTERIEERL